MYTQQIALFVLAAAAAVSAVPPPTIPRQKAPLIPRQPGSTLNARQNGVTCQTSSGSPKTEDITDVINEVRGDGGKCSQTNGHASDCTTLVSHNSAAISICGGKDEEGEGHDCTEVAGFANQIQQACLNNGLAGGTYTIGPSQRVEVIHS